VVIAVMKVTGQVTMPEMLLKNSLKEQLNYIEDHTKIFEYYRAIREDMFQKIKGNVSDTLSAINNKVTVLNKKISVLNLTIDSLRTNLESTKARLDESTRTKNSIRVFGMEVNKFIYNRIIFTILLVLIVAMIMGFVIYKRNLFILVSTKEELQDIKVEFEAYRKTCREAREKLIMDHFKEMKKLKGG
jgi:predicted small metal-binding protein